MKILFILKRREDYSTVIANRNDYTVATGLYNSAKFVSDMLNNHGIESQLSIVVDNNDIDREVTLYKPNWVIIEGFWVVPEKFDILKPLHPTVRWMVRCHSELPFLASEGIAIKWIHGYADRGIKLSGNSPRINRELESLVGLAQQPVYLPNYYPCSKEYNYSNLHYTKVLDISCFGAIRPMKNHLLQAIAAINLSDSLNKKLRFHINVGRVEMNGSPALNNLRALFDNSQKHELVEHNWANHAHFLKVLRLMDLSLQVSFTETFNIVTADAVSVGIPVVTSPEIKWVAPECWAAPVDTKGIENVMYNILRNPYRSIARSKQGLNDYSLESEKQWLNFFSNGTLSTHQQDIRSKLVQFFWKCWYYIESKIRND